MVAGVAVACIPLVVQVVVDAQGVPWTGQVGSDYAGYENDVRTALDGDLLLGTSTRLAVRNLGPAHGYWTAVWYAVVEGAGGMVIAAWLLHVLALTAVIAVVRSISGDRMALLAGFVLALAWLRAGPAVLSDFYNPAFTVPAVLAATVAAAALVKGDWRWLPLVVTAASVGAQFHIAAVPGLVLVSVAGVVAGLRVARPNARLVLASAALLLVLWTPTLVDQFNGTGNLSRLLAVVDAGPGTSDQPFGQPEKSAPRDERAYEAAQIVTLTAPNAAARGSLFGLLLYARSHPTTMRTVLAMSLLGVAVAVAVFSRWRDTFGATILRLGLLGATATYLLSGFLDRGFLIYYFAPLAGYGLALWLGAGLIILRPFAERDSQRRVVFLAGTAAITVVAIATAEPKVSELLKTGANPVDQVYFANRLADAVPEACIDRGIALTALPEQIADVWTVIVSLDRRGINATVPRDLEPFVNPGHERTGSEAAVVQVPGLDELRQRTWSDDVAWRCP